jgi:hypothetical protein
MPQSTQTVRLHELLTALGCPRHVAPLDPRSFATRAGELISRATSARPMPRATHLHTELGDMSAPSLQRRRRGTR